jgi:hypothetical protein
LCTWVVVVVEVEVVVRGGWARTSMAGLRGR